MQVVHLTNERFSMDFIELKWYQACLSANSYKCCTTQNYSPLECLDGVNGLDCVDIPFLMVNFLNNHRDRLNLNSMDNMLIVEFSLSFRTLELKAAIFKKLKNTHKTELDSSIHFACETQWVC